MTTQHGYSKLGTKAVIATSLFCTLRGEDLSPQVIPQVTAEVTAEVERLLGALEGEMPRALLQQALALQHDEHFRKAYLAPALAAGLIEMTLPDKPRSSKQRYRLTDAGRAWKTAQREGQDR